VFYVQVSRWDINDHLMSKWASAFPEIPRWLSENGKFTSFCHTHWSSNNIDQRFTSTTCTGDGFRVNAQTDTGKSSERTTYHTIYRFPDQWFFCSKERERSRNNENSVIMYSLSSSFNTWITFVLPWKTQNEMFCRMSKLPFSINTAFQGPKRTETTFSKW